MSFFTKAVVESLKRFPAVNASIDGQDIIYHGYYDIGIAVSTERGLVVPVVRDADLLSMATIERTISDSAARARQGKLSMEDMQGGTFTITNGGVFGSLLATPIINPPQTAILGMHKIQDRPIAENGQVVIRPMMYLAISSECERIAGRSISFITQRLGRTSIMNLHEYQAKELFASYGLPVPRGEVAFNVEDALQVAAQLPTLRWVVKAQVHAGGRGKAGGVKLVSTKEELVEYTKSLLGTRLVTYQTDAHGQPVNSVLVEEVSDIDRELYLGAVVDRATRRVVFMASTEGGVEIEKVAEHTPEKIFTVTVDPMTGVMPFQCREVAFKLGLTDSQVSQFTNLMIGLGKMFVECDLSLLEINPLVVTKSGDIICLDGKVTIDDNALYRHPRLKAMRDASQEDDRVNSALDWELNYIPLDGSIGCMVNGAGLAMATMDVIKLHGGDPANFLDVGGGATKERVSEAFKIILSDEKVKGILVNIFGGIVRCDLIAEGILAAVKEINVDVPVVVRLEGNNAELGADILNKSDLNVIGAKSLTDAAKKIVAAIA